MKTSSASMETQVTTTHNGRGTREMAGPVPGRKPGLALLMRLLSAAALLLPALGARAAVVFTNLHVFRVNMNAANPQGGLVQGSDGNFYGTTYGGGSKGAGAVFKISTNGALTTLHVFTGGNDGASPGALVQGSDGAFYGTTAGRGAYTVRSAESYGTVFRISTSGALTTLYSFTGGDDGAYPRAGLVQGSDGYFYGTTAGGDPSVLAYGGHGTVFKISTNGALTTLHVFTGGNDGASPGALVQGSDGAFYGTTYVGGPSDTSGLAYGGYGTVFRINANGVLTNLYSFTGTNDGRNPQGGLVQGSDGNFYGTSYWGGNNGFGTVFKISTNGALTTLHVFTGGNDGAFPGALVQGSDGAFYGTTQGDGANRYTLYGNVFRINANGVLTNLYSFGATNDGASPGGLVQGSDGNFYGTTLGGLGTVFQMSPDGALKTLYSFTATIDGARPQGGLIQASDGNFYGTTWGGGTNDSGTVFEISANGAYTSLYSFTGTNDGAYPYAGLVQGSDGNFYGTTTSGGTNGGYGTVFRISANGALTSLHSFTGGNDGANPQSGLVQGSDGNFYGTTESGGTYTNYGTVFKISANGALTSLYSFTGTNDGANPYGGLVQGSDGYFYGTTSAGGTYGYSFDLHGLGTVFKLSPDGALTTLHAFGAVSDTNDFGFPVDGATPYAGLVQGGDGDLYGTTAGALEHERPGTAFKISTNGMLTTLAGLRQLTPGVFGNNPSGLVVGSDGSVYGVTYWDAPNPPTPAWGVIFKISANGTVTSLYSFPNGSVYGSPPAGLVLGRDGGFYGTTEAGGWNGPTYAGAGTVFRFTIVPEFQAVTLTNTTLSLTWSTEAGGTYQLQYSSDLSTTNWTNLGSAVTAAGATLSTTDSIANGPQRFYRLVLAP